jgi:hypothetical protein
MTELSDKYADWIKEPDGKLQLWPSLGGACAVIAEQIIALRVDYLHPDGEPDQIYGLQVHMKPEDAIQLGLILIEYARDALSAQTDVPMN